VFTAERGGVIRRPAFGRLVWRPALAHAGLLDRLVATVRKAGYQRVRLDSPDFMTAAHGLYRSSGFMDIEPYPRARFRTSTSPTGSSWRRVSRDAVAPNRSRAECRVVTELTLNGRERSRQDRTFRRVADRLRGGPDAPGGAGRDAAGDGPVGVDLRPCGQGRHQWLAPHGEP
jgi:hypothetical protein